MNKSTSMRRFSLTLTGIGAILLLIASAGCVNCSCVKTPSGVPVTEKKADATGFTRVNRDVGGTLMGSQEIVAGIDRLAHSIMQIPEIAKTRGISRVVMEPLVNETRFPINKDLILTRIRGLLNEKTRSKVQFVAREYASALNQQRFLKQDGQVTGTADPDFVEGGVNDVDFFLVGKLQAETVQTSAGISDYILLSLQLFKVRTGKFVWEGQQEIRRRTSANNVTEESFR